MSYNWNLDKLYTSFDSQALEQDLKRITELLDTANAFTNTSFSSTDNAVSKLEKYIDYNNQIGDLWTILDAYGNLNYSVNTNDEKALKLIERVEAIMPNMTLLEVALQKFVSKIDNLDDLIQASPILQEHAFMLKENKAKSQYLLSEQEEKLLAEMKNTGSNAWNKLQDATASSLLVDMDGEQKTLTVVRNLAHDKDPEVRKKAYEAELKAYEKIDKVSASCLNAIKGEVITVAKKRGYASPLEMTLVHSRMDKETLDAMITAVKEYLPFFRKYLKKKAELLGHKNGLPFHDLFAPIGTVDMTFTYEETKDFIETNFNTFSKKLGSYAKRAFDENWIDVKPKEGKVGGAFCCNIHGIKESRILTNFSGTFSSVTTVAHELGHGYHGDVLSDATYTNSDYPMPLAETASIFCEIITKTAALNKATKEEALVILDTSITESTQVVVDIYSRYLFETELFKRREQASLSVNDLKTIMIEAQKEAYGDGLDPEYLHPYMWACKPHYYYADYNFYNFPYTFGELFAKGLYAKFKEVGSDFVSKYDALLMETGRNSIHNVLKTLDIDSHSSDFWRSSLETTKEQIEQFLQY